MQGKKTYSEKLFTSFQLSDRVSTENFYRRLKENINLDFISLETKKYYGNCGQQSIDPTVFFKLMLVGYLENIISDRKLIEHCSMRLDILYFLGYDIDEALPWHSTISRTRQLYDTSVFELLFNKVFAACVDKGMVSGHTQSIDSAYIKANASMDSLEVKQPAQELNKHIQELQLENNEPIRKSKNDKSSTEQRRMATSEQELNELKSRYEYQQKINKDRPGSNDVKSKFYSNKTHYSPTDPDARVSVKPGKPRQLNYMCSMAVDSFSHVITHIQANLADKKDSQYLLDIVNNTNKRLRNNFLGLSNILADTAYSSGENYHALENENIQAWIPVHGQYKNEREGFIYNEEEDCYICPNNKKVVFKKAFTERDGRLLKRYTTTRHDCKDCPFRETCIGKTQEKKFDITYYHKEYQRAYNRQHSLMGRYMKKKRQSTVEPVFGTLINFLGLRKINVKGQSGAHKVMTMAAIAYNLKKSLKSFTSNLIGVSKAIIQRKTDLFTIHIVRYELR